MYCRLFEYADSRREGSVSLFLSRIYAPCRESVEGNAAIKVLWCSPYKADTRNLPFLRQSMRLQLMHIFKLNIVLQHFPVLVLTVPNQHVTKLRREPRLKLHLKLRQYDMAMEFQLNPRIHL